MRPDELDPLDAGVLEKLLAGDHRVLAALRRQVAEATAVHRELSGVGFFTRFTLPETTAPAPVRCLRFGDVHGDIAGLQHGAGFVLFVDEGRITMLEGFSYGEPWPEEVNAFAIRYFDPMRPQLTHELAGLQPTRRE